MSFVMDCVQDSLPIWQQCLDTEFLRRMEDGTLDPACFAGYILDDSIYLREYAKVFAAGMLKARSLEEMKTYYTFLSFINEDEGATRLEYLRRMGLDANSADAYPARPENAAYTGFMIRATQEGTTGAECMMAGLPCMLSYAWIFHTMAQRTPAVLDGPFGEMIRDYILESGDRLCEEWAAYANGLCEHLTEEEKQQCMGIFRQSSLYELGFWQMSQSPRADLILPATAE